MSSNSKRRRKVKRGPLFDAEMRQSLVEPPPRLICPSAGPFTRAINWPTYAFCKDSPLRVPSDWPNPQGQLAVLLHDLLESFRRQLREERRVYAVFRDGGREGEGKRLGVASTPWLERHPYLTASVIHPFVEPCIASASGSFITIPWLTPQLASLVAGYAATTPYATGQIVVFMNAGDHEDYVWTKGLDVAIVVGPSGKEGTYRIADALWTPHQVPGATLEIDHGDLAPLTYKKANV